MELEEKTDEEDVESSSSDEDDSNIEEEDNFYDICKTENEKENQQSDEKSKWKIRFCKQMIFYCFISIQRKPKWYFCKFNKSPRSNKK